MDEFVERLRSIAERDAAEAHGLTEPVAFGQRVNPQYGITDDEADKISDELLVQFDGRAFATWHTPEAKAAGRVAVQPASSGTTPNFDSKDADLLSVHIERNSWGVNEDVAAQMRQVLVTGEPPMPTVHFTKDQWLEFVAFGNSVFGIDS